MLQQYQMIGEIFFRFRAKLHWKKLSIAVYCKCMDRNTCDISSDSEVMLSFFSCSKFSVRVYNTSDVPTGQTFTINWLKIQLSWVLMLYYPYKTIVFQYSTYKSAIVSPCACDLFEAKWRKSLSTWVSVFGSHFSALFQGVMTVSWN